MVFNLRAGFTPPKGAHASALLYSLIETAKASDQEPYAWLLLRVHHENVSDPNGTSSSRNDRSSP